MICKSTLLEKASSAQRKDIVRRYQPVDFLGVYADTAGKPYMIKSTIFHFGPPTITVMEPDDVVEVKTESAKFIVLSVQMPNIDGAKDLETKLKLLVKKWSPLRRGTTICMAISSLAGHAGALGCRAATLLSTSWKASLPLQMIRKLKSAANHGATEFFSILCPTTQRIRISAPMVARTWNMQ